MVSSRTVFGGRLRHGSQSESPVRVSVEVCSICIVDGLHVCACFAVTADVGWCGVYVFATYLLFPLSLCK